MDIRESEVPWDFFRGAMTHLQITHEIIEVQSMVLAFVKFRAEQTSVFLPWNTCLITIKIHPRADYCHCLSYGYLNLSNKPASVTMGSCINNRLVSCLPVCPFVNLSASCPISFRRVCFFISRRVDTSTLLCIVYGHLYALTVSFVTEYAIKFRR